LKERERRRKVGGEGSLYLEEIEEIAPNVFGEGIRVLANDEALLHYIRIDHLLTMSILALLFCH